MFSVQNTYLMRRTRNTNTSENFYYRLKPYLALLLLTFVAHGLYTAIQLQVAEPLSSAARSGSGSARSGDFGGDFSDSPPMRLSWVLQERYSEHWSDSEWSYWEETMKTAVRKIEKEVGALAFDVEPDQPDPRPLDLDPLVMKMKMMDMEQLAKERDAGVSNARHIANETVMKAMNMNSQKNKASKNNAKNASSTSTSSSFDRFSIPVLGTVVTGEDPRRFLARLLWSIDETVGAIVITWYGSGKNVQKTLEAFVRKHSLVEAPFKLTGTNNTPTPTPKEEVLVSVSWDSPPSEARPFRRFVSLPKNRNRNRNASSSVTLPCVQLIVARYSMNLGCATGYNNPAILVPSAPWWLIVNSDIAFPPGKLYAIGQSMHHVLATPRKTPAGIHFFGFLYGRGSSQHMNIFSLFALTAASVARVGLFDENIFPAYYEDNDYENRIRRILGHDAVIFKPLPNVSVAHGSAHAAGYESGTKLDMERSRSRHDGRGIMDHEHWKLLLNIALPGKYYDCKYTGKGKSFALPFNRSTEDWSHWTFNATRRRCVYEGAARVMSHWDVNKLTWWSRRRRHAEVRRLSDECAVCHSNPSIESNVALD